MNLIECACGCKESFKPSTYRKSLGNRHCKTVVSKYKRGHHNKDKNAIERLRRQSQNNIFTKEAKEKSLQKLKERNLTYKKENNPNWRGGKDKICEMCTTMFWTSPSIDSRFCSNICRIRWLLLNRYSRKFRIQHPSKPQRLLYTIVQKYFGKELVEPEYPIKCINNKLYFIDVGVSKYKVGFEYDGKYWHQNRKNDIQKHFDIVGEGWTLFHFDAPIKKLEQQFQEKLNP